LIQVRKEEEESSVIDAESSKGGLLNPLNTFGSLDSGEERRTFDIP
jgi:hypothetical protein